MNPRMVLFSASLPGWTARKVIDTARQLGFRAIEWGIGPGEALEDPRCAAEIRTQCTHAGLRCGGISVQEPRVTLATPELALAAIDLGIALGAPHVRLRAPHYELDGLRRQRELTREGLALLVRQASPHGLAVLVETSPETLAPTPESAQALIVDHSPAHAGVLYDPGNMIIEGHVQPRLAIEHLHRHLAHVHVKNISWRRRAGAWAWHYSRLASGMVDWPAILTALATVGYPGRFSIDHLCGPATRYLLEAEALAFSRLVNDAFEVREPTLTPSPS